MMEEQRYCPDIIIQLQAVHAAIKGLALEMLDGHISSCVKEAFEQADTVEQDSKIAEIKNLIRKFD
ncbi:MAG: metal-sensitive transcriptional regulator [Candidatus Rickettsia vulgarisii]